MTSKEYKDSLTATLKRVAALFRCDPASQIIRLNRTHFIFLSSVEKMDFLH
ncbi:hypothetical cytosolic protein [Syntrophus aciditrophicus SB]|uniref:Hypothetical cytosolic protein n=1 Tax=Syntrophus aciditrophicus (strain SB) TaxID=56780 RepID=Q2LVV3_SYNAS|nr:hypothetical cytosolic protein [Syntrophus aciditrophicus SB]